MSPVVVTKIKVHIPRNFWCGSSLESFTTNWDECENHRKVPKSKVNAINNKDKQEDHHGPISLT